MYLNIKRLSVYFIAVLSLFLSSLDAVVYIGVISKVSKKEGRYIRVIKFTPQISKFDKINKNRLIGKAALIDCKLKEAKDVNIFLIKGSNKLCSFTSKFEDVSFGGKYEDDGSGFKELYNNCECVENEKELEEAKIYLEYKEENGQKGSHDVIEDNNKKEQKNAGDVKNISEEQKNAGGVKNISEEQKNAVDVKNISLGNTSMKVITSQDSSEIAKIIGKLYAFSTSNDMFQELTIKLDEKKSSRAQFNGLFLKTSDSFCMIQCMATKDKRSCKSMFEKTNKEIKIENIFKFSYLSKILNAIKCNEKYKNLYEYIEGLGKDTDFYALGLHCYKEKFGKCEEGDVFAYKKSYKVGQLKDWAIFIQKNDETIKKLSKMNEDPDYLEKKLEMIDKIDKNIEAYCEEIEKIKEKEKDDNSKKGISSDVISENNSKKNGNII